MNHEFTFEMTGVENNDAFANAVYEAGCDDCTIVYSGGKLKLHFDREAETRRQAIDSAAAQLREHIDYRELFLLVEGSGRKTE